MTTVTKPESYWWGAINWRDDPYSQQFQAPTQEELRAMVIAFFNGLASQGGRPLLHADASLETCALAFTNDFRAVAHFYEWKP